MILLLCRSEMNSDCAFLFVFQVLYYRKNPGIIYHFTVPTNTVDRTLESIVPSSATIPKHLRRQINSRKSNTDVVLPKSTSSESTWPFRTYDRRYSQQRNRASSQNSSLEISSSKPKYISVDNSQRGQEQQPNGPNVRDGYRVIPNRRQTAGIDSNSNPRSYSDLVKQSAKSVHSRRYYDSNGKRIYPASKHNELGSSDYSRANGRDQPLFNDNSFSPRYRNSPRYQNKPLLSSSHLAALTGSPKYFWRIAGFTDCSLSCGGGEFKPTFFQILLTIHYT